MKDTKELVEEIKGKSLRQQYYKLAEIYRQERANLMSEIQEGFCSGKDSIQEKINGISGKSLKVIEQLDWPEKAEPAFVVYQELKTYERLGEDVHYPISYLKLMRLKNEARKDLERLFNIAPKLALLDMDGVLIEETSWQVVHDYFEVNNEDNFDKYKAGEISYEDFMRQDIELWKRSDKKEATIENVERAVANIELRPGIEKLIAALRKKGYEEILIVSGGIPVLAVRIAQQSCLDGALTNDFETTEKEGKVLITGAKCKFDFSKKGKIMRGVAEELELSLEQSLAIGDSRFDTGMLETADLGIAFNPKDQEVKRAADVIVNGNDLSEIIQYL